MLVTWFLSRLVEDDESSLDIHQLYEQFVFEQLESGISTPNIARIKLFIEHLKVFFPNIQRKRKSSNAKRDTLYQKLSLKPLGPLISTSMPFSDILLHIPDHYFNKVEKDGKICCQAQTGSFCNGHSVNKVVTFHQDHTWELKIGGTIVQLERIYIDKSFQQTVEGILLVFKCVDKIKLCCGVKVANSNPVIVNRYRTLELWQQDETSAPFRSFRSSVCLKVIFFNHQTLSCRICQKMTIPCTKTKTSPSSSIEQPSLSIE